MPVKHLFEYAAIRLVPRVEREEFINVGVIVYCAPQAFLQTRCHLPIARAQAFAGIDLDWQDIDRRLRVFEQICQGQAEGGPIGCLAASARFRWLTANRSTIIQTSPTHPGLCESAAETLERLFGQLAG